MAVAVEQAHFFRDILPILQLGADVSTEKQILSFVRSGRTAEDERMLRLFDVSVRPVFVLAFDRDGMSAKIKVKPVCHFGKQATR
ncbi:MAG: hypothetical protein L0Z53_15430 [Acidobacteriales bacterium]|nr:hypothetical protein [Terriglobales bacterium]